MELTAATRGRRGGWAAVAQAGSRAAEAPARAVWRRSRRAMVGEDMREAVQVTELVRCRKEFSRRQFSAEFLKRECD